MIILSKLYTIGVSLFIVALGLFVPIATVYAALDFPLREGETILTQDAGDVVGETIRDSEDVLRDGTEAIAEGIGDAGPSGRIFFEEVEDTAEAWTELTRTIRGIVNWILGISGIILLLYVIYHGFIVLAAGGNDEKIAVGRKGVRNGLFAIMGIALAWFIVSIVFWLINLLIA